MSVHRLDTHAPDSHFLEECFIALDLTRLDFRSIPALDYYVKYWFTNVDDFIDHLSSLSNQRITLIASDLLTHISCGVLRAIFPQITRVIIIGKRSYQYENVEHFRAVQALVDHLFLIRRQRRRLYITFHSWPVERTSHNLNKHTSKFLWYSYFYNILSSLTNTNVARAEMLDSIQAFHTGQTDSIKRSCEEFEKSYNSMDIIQWYTKTSFFYLLLNRTLRSENINHIFAMRSVIFDLENYLKNHCDRNPSINTVYRGQQIHRSEIEEMESNLSGLIGMTAFWSASRSIEVARDFLEIWPPERTDNVERVLFTIKIPSNVERAVYADISTFSTDECEFEILFSFRSLFRIECVVRDGNDGVWYVNLTLIDDTNEQFLSIMHSWYPSTNQIIGYRWFFTPQKLNSEQTSFCNVTFDNQSFLTFQLLVDIILRLDRNEFARHELLEVCRENYSDDQIELDKIDAFECTYDARNAIRWYTTDCFLYRLINHSLRTGAIDLIFKLRYFIRDLHDQLAQMQTEIVRLLSPNTRILKLYRGFRMALKELQVLQENQDDFLSTSSFLSTTSDYQAALFFAGDGNVDENFVSVIYKIKVDLSVKHSTLFAKIDYKSIFKDEDEFLFSMGAVFRIGQITQVKDRLWKIELTLTSTEGEQWSILTSHLNS